jgi:hypothetical protein
MIHYDLRCAKDHVFDAWFRDSAAFDELARQKKLVCPACGSKKVVKAPMAPRLAKSRSSSEPIETSSVPLEPVPSQIPGPIASEPGGRKVALMAGQRRMIEELRRHVEANCHYVGPNFAEEARRIHYGETEQRSIYGEASEEEATALADEGIEVHSIPWPARSDA